MTEQIKIEIDAQGMIDRFLAEAEHALNRFDSDIVQTYDRETQLETARHIQHFVASLCVVSMSLCSNEHVLQFRNVMDRLATKAQEIANGLDPDYESPEERKRNADKSGLSIG